LQDMARHPDYLTNADRLKNRAEMTRRLSEKTRALSKAALLQACEEKGVPAGPINDLKEVFADPQVQARGMVQTVEGIPTVRSPFSFSDADLAIGAASPGLDRDRAEILAKIKSDPGD